VSEAALAAVRGALAGAEAWIVGGAVRDELLGRPVSDVDLAVAGDAKPLARALSRATGSASFPLSDTFGAWRVIGPEQAWQVDLMPLQGDTLAEDLARRDFTVNAMARTVEWGPLIDPYSGTEDLASGLLRMVGERAFADDPLRVLRLVRFACELALRPEIDTVAAAVQQAGEIDRVAAERVFAELKRVIASDRVVGGLELMDSLGLTPHVLPELSGLRGVEQNRYHHLDVHDHTLEVLAETVAFERSDAVLLDDPELDARIRAFLAQPFSDEITRGTALRFGALLHDVAKPETQAFREDGSVLGFPGHADLGAERSRAALTRLKASEKLRAHVALLARHHLGLGYLVHKAPLDKRTIHQYLVKTSPVEVDVSLLSIADRLATRGRKADEAITKHLAIARTVLPAALAFPTWQAQPPLLRGDELAAAISIKPGPALGSLLAQLDEAHYAGDITTPDQALQLARTLL
jgi:poly(A) polymerase